jgi:hypothetical protein
VRNSDSRSETGIVVGWEGRFDPFQDTLQAERYNIRSYVRTGGEVADLSFQDLENDLLGLVKLLERIILRKKSDLICINPRFTSA